MTLLALAGAAAVRPGTSPMVTFSDALAAAAAHGYFATGSRWEEEAPRLEARIRAASTLDEARSPAAALVDISGGPHSMLLSAAEVAGGASVDRLAGAGSAPSVQLDGRVGVVRLPAFTAVDQRQASAYATQAVTGIRAAASSATCGWVVDLRDNSGGTMLAMLAAVSPLLPDGPVMSVVGRDGRHQPVRVVGNSVVTTGDGGALSGGFVPVKVPAAHVAVLTDARTASAAEAVAVALRAAPVERSFGAATRGLTSFNEAFALPDGWALRLTTGVYADVSGHAYADVPLRPDVAAGAPLDAALGWLAGVAGPRGAGGAIGTVPDDASPGAVARTCGVAPQR